jgi:HD-GYP domain-containing protein (c-di-GMP phosphodiesterase class II)
MPEYDIHDEITLVIAQITAAVTNASLYSPNHPQVGQYMEKAYGVLTGMLRNNPEVTILLIGNDLVAGNKPLPPAGVYVVNFIRALRKKAVERVTFVAGLPKEEFQGFILDLANPDAVSIRSRAYVKLGKVELRIRQYDERAGASPAPASPVSESAQLQDVPPEALQELMALTATELDELKDIYFSIKKHKQISVRGIDEIVKGFIKGFRQEINPLGLLASLKSSHEYTFTHVTNVGILTMSQAETLGFTGEHLHQIGVASLLHDVGKLFVPEDILNKPGKLSQEERKIIETHTTKGARYLMGLDGIPKLAVLAALEHHLKYDGTGYPSIKGGWRPNIASQIIAISDVFDAMRSRRSYQEPQPLEKIEEVLRKGSGTQFNPKLVEHFLRLIKRR